MQQPSSVLADDVERFEHEMDRMLHTFFPHEHRRQPSAWRPPTDVYETDEAIIVKIEIAGMTPEDFEIAFSDRLLTVSGARLDREMKQTFHRLEIPYGEFMVNVLLAGNYAEDQVEARYENGFLYVTLPKKEEQTRVHVRVQAGSN
jgi:HSP20 family protein